MALLSFVESAPRAYRLKVGNADLFRNSTEPGTSPAAARTGNALFCVYGGSGESAMLPERLTPD
jgi:hypothetical protein